MAEQNAEPHKVTGLKLRAEDAEDMAVIAACLQDAVVIMRDMTYLPKQRRFAMVVSRYCWEGDPSGEQRRERSAGRGWRTRTGVHFDGVLKVDTLGFDTGNRTQALELLTIAVEPGGDGAALLLMFAGGAIVRLAVECIECRLSDIGPAWETPLRPRHGLDERRGATRRTP
jgi:hypothetical protein